MAQVSTLFDIMKTTTKPFPERHTGEFALEIETEVDNSKRYEYPRMKFWTPKKDNSLRDYGVEYVMKGPVLRPELGNVLEEFQGANDKYKFRTNTVSTSVHVHVNMHNETFLTIANFLTAYALVENLLIRYSGPDRLSNLFCLALCDAEGLLDKWQNMLNQVGRKNFTKSGVSQEMVKYSALNIGNLFSLGTLEVRSFRGETDTAVIERWVHIIGKLKDFASSDGLTPSGIMKLWKEHKMAIVEIIFHEYAKELMCKDAEKLVTQNVLYAARLSVTSKDWAKYGILKIKPVYKEFIKKELMELASAHFRSEFDGLDYHQRMAVYELYQRQNPINRIVDADDDV
jgi:hypothetical protein